MKNLRSMIAALSLTLAVSCAEQTTEKTQIAVIADPHLQEVENNPHLVRTMVSELGSTRLYNENEIVLKATLDDIAKRNIKLVAIAGDVSDDGQWHNLRAVDSIFRVYEERYNMRFFIAPGNHDPTSPYGEHYTASVYLDEQGAPYTLSSDSTVVGARFIPEMYRVGYERLIETLSKQGYNPRPDDIYWATPYSSYTPESYTYELAQGSSSLDQRLYTLEPWGEQMPDASYVVEPVQGIWLLSIDGNVYTPKQTKGEYNGSGLGYDNVLNHKRFLIDWVAQVAEQARQRGKILVPFSHYPLTDFSDGQRELTAKVFGEDRLALGYIPSEELTALFADTKIGFHFGGHLHFNDVFSYTSPNGNKLINIQVPSTVAAIPGYKILEIESGKAQRVVDVTLSDVVDFDKLFPIYDKELAHYRANAPQMLYDTTILSTKNYQEFCVEHFRQISTSMFLDRDFPEHFRDKYLKQSGRELMEAFSKTDENFEGFEEWNMKDLIMDFYLLRSAGNTAFDAIGKERLDQYNKLIECVNNSQLTDQDPADEFLRGFITIFSGTLRSEPVQLILLN